MNDISTDPDGLTAALAEALPITLSILDLSTDGKAYGLVIVDEVMTGFGRTGRRMAVDHWGVEPDILVSGKGLTGGYAPMGGIFAREEVVEPIAARPTLASAIQIGNPVSMEKAIDAMRRYDGVVEQASEAELAEACASADRTGLFNCPHTGVALAALNKLLARGVIQSSDRVVVMSTAHGLKFIDFKIGYHRMKLEGIVPELANPPIELPANYPEVRDRMLREIEQRTN